LHPAFPISRVDPAANTDCDQNAYYCLLHQNRIALNLAVTPEPELESYHPFPPLSRLSSLGFEYRTDFIQRTAKMLGDAYGAGPSSKGKEGPERWLYALRKMATTGSDARQELLKLMGVGRKVADCILLMSLDKVSHICWWLRFYGIHHQGSPKSFLSIHTFIRLR